jgi:EpsI family protein
LLRSRLLLLNLILLLALLGNHWGRRIESATITQKDTLMHLALPFRDWKITDSKMDKGDWNVLEPDAALIRHYQSPQNEEADLTVVMGHRKRTVHTPTLCMSGGGWEILSQRYLDLPIPGRKVHAVRQLMTRQGKRAYMTYFFTDGDFCSPSLAQFQTVQLLKRLKARIPMGALVRTILPVGDDLAAADELSNAFAAATIPEVLNTVQNARLEMH